MFTLPKRIISGINARIAKLQPRLRALVIYIIAIAVLFPVATILYGSIVLGLIWGAMLGLFALYMALRSGYFSQTVMLHLPGNDAPTPEKIRSVQGGVRFTNWDQTDYLAPADADEALSLDQRVIGLEIDGDAMAYPLSAMSLREVANEDIEDVPISVTWSPVSYSPRAFIARGADGSPITLSPTPKMLLNTSLLESDNGTLYMQFTGEAIDGPDAGHRLQHIPCVNTTWGAWSSAWHDSDAMSPGGTPEDDVFEGYYASTRPGLYSQPAKDKRLPDKDVVLGVMVSGRYGGSKCYSAHVLREDPLLHDQIGSTSVIVLCERSSATYVAFNTAVDRDDLTFRGVNRNPYRPNRVVDRGQKVDESEGGIPNSPYDPWMLQDDQTGSVWHAISGVCVEGEYKGARLSMLDGRLAFWFAWSKLHADIELMV